MSEPTVSNKSRIALGLVIVVIGAAAAISAGWAVMQDRVDTHVQMREPHLTPTELEDHFPPRDLWESELNHLQEADREQTKLLKEIREEVR